MSVPWLSKVRKAPLSVIQWFLIHTSLLAGTDTVSIYALHFLFCASSTELGMQSSNTLLAVFSALAMYPEVLKRAQAELDAVVGLERLPDFGDQESLVYVNAIVKEALRWHPVLPLGIPHRTIADDVLDGYFVPAGTMILTNVWYV